MTGQSSRTSTVKLQCGARSIIFACSIVMKGFSFLLPHLECEQQQILTREEFGKPIIHGVYNRTSSGLIVILENLSSKIKHDVDAIY